MPMMLAVGVSSCRPAAASPPIHQGAVLARQAAKRKTGGAHDGNQIARVGGVYTERMHPPNPALPARHHDVRPVPA